MNCVIRSPWIGINNGPMSIWEPNFKWITAPAHVDPTTLEIPGIFVPTNCQNPEHGWETTSFAMQCQILLRHRHEIFLAKPQKNNRQLVNPGIATPQGEIKQLKSNKHIPFKNTIRSFQFHLFANGSHFNTCYTTNGQPQMDRGKRCAKNAPAKMMWNHCQRRVFRRFAIGLVVQRSGNYKI